MLLFFKSLLDNKIKLTVVGLTLIWIIIDSLQRFVPHHNTSQNTSLIQNVDKLVSPQLTLATFEQIEQFYGYNSNQSIEEPYKGMPSELQNKQNGILKSVYAGEYKLQLKAVIQSYTGTTDASNRPVSANDFFVLLEVTNLNNNEIKTVKFLQNDDVYGYKLTIKPNTEVQLTKSSEETKSKITLVMYETSKQVKINK